jgi:hypothetical protein
MLGINHPIIAVMTTSNIESNVSVGILTSNMLDALPIDTTKLNSDCNTMLSIVMCSFLGVVAMSKSSSGRLTFAGIDNVC